MCDYSLHGVKSRLAVEGEHLFIHKFHTGSRGLASVVDMAAAKPCGIKRLWSFLMREDPRAAAQNVPAVCVPPGARLQLSGIPAPMQQRYGVESREEVTFAQLTAEPFRYRDAMRFDNGAEILIQKFSEGIRVEVLQLALNEEAALVAVPAGREEWIVANV